MEFFLDYFFRGLNNIWVGNADVGFGRKQLGETRCQQKRPLARPFKLFMNCSYGFASDNA
jgi:hypothetical protein